VERQPSKKQTRQLEAQRRQRLKPQLDRVRDIEKRLAENRMELEMLEKRLADETLYSDPDRREELTGLIKQQGAIKASMESSEWEWLEASEALENMQ
jgi:ATP-binding cassette subfamily F protein 3